MSRNKRMDSAIGIFEKSLGFRMSENQRAYFFSISAQWVENWKKGSQRWQPKRTTKAERMESNG